MHSPHWFQFLAKDLGRQTDGHHYQTRFQIRILLHPSPVFALEALQDIGVNKDKVGPLIDVGGSQTNVLHKRPASLIQPDVVDDIGHDQVIGSGFVIEVFKMDRITLIGNEQSSWEGFQ